MKGITMEWESEMEIRVHMVLGDGSFCVSSNGDEIGK
jgi:hypothetical protein